MNKKQLVKVSKTLCLSLIYCVVWILLEVLMNGMIVDRPIDNMMMLLFLPVIYKAVE